jgi:hypothetical protein
MKLVLNDDQTTLDLYKNCDVFEENAPEIVLLTS